MFLIQMALLVGSLVTIGFLVMTAAPIRHTNPF